MDEAVLVNADVDESAEIRHVRHDAGQFHAALEVLQFVDVVGEPELLRRLAGIAAGLAEFLHDVRHRRQAEIALHIFRRIDPGAERLVPDQFLRRNAQVGRHAVHQMVRLGMHRGIVQRILRPGDPEEARTLLERFRTELGHLHQFLPGRKAPRRVAIGDDVPGQHGADARHIAQQVGAGGVEVNAHPVHAGDDGVVQFLAEQPLVHVVLVLPDAERLGIDLHQFGERVHEPAADRDGAAHRDVLVGKLLARHLGRGIDGSTVFTDGVHLHRLRKAHPADEFLRLAGRRPVADGDHLHAVRFHHVRQAHDRLHLLVLRRMREEDLVVQQAAALVQADDLAAVAETGVDGHRPFLADRRGKQELGQVLTEDGDRFQVCLLLGLGEHFIGNGRLQQALVRVVDRRVELLGETRGGTAARPAEIVIHPRRTALRIRIDAQRKETFVAGAEHGQQIVRRDPLQRHREVEIRAVLGRLGRRRGRFRGRPDDPSGTERAAQGLTDRRRLREVLGDDVPRPGEGLLHVRHLPADKGSRLFPGIVRNA